MFKRMHLVPATPSLPPPSKSPYVQPLSKLDVSMKNILVSPNTDDYEKAKLYTQTLQRYLDVNRKYVDEPLKVMLTSLVAASPQLASPKGSPGAPGGPAGAPSPAAAAAPSSPGAPAPGEDSLPWEESEDDETSLGLSPIKPAHEFPPNFTNVPKTYQNRIRRFLQSGAVDFDEHGQVLDKLGEPVPGSNIVQLVLGRITDNKKVARLTRGMPGMSIIRRAIAHKRSLRKSTPLQRARPEAATSHSLITFSDSPLKLDAVGEASAAASQVDAWEEDYY